LDEKAAGITPSQEAAVDENVPTRTEDASLVMPAELDGAVSETDASKIKNRVLAKIASRIEARDAQVDFGSTTLHGFAKFSKC
jgi:hypothetical protein